MTRARGPLFKLKPRRRRRGLTNYAKRLALLKSGLPRLVVRKSNRYIYAQMIEFDPRGDRVAAQANSMELRRYGFEGKCNTPSAYLVGYLAGGRALKKGITKAILDAGLQSPTKGSLIFAALKGAVDAGLEVPHREDVIPGESRIRGAHLGLEASFLKALEEIRRQLQS